MLPSLGYLLPAGLLDLRVQVDRDSPLLKDPLDLVGAVLVQKLLALGEVVVLLTLLLTVEIPEGC